MQKSSEQSHFRSQNWMEMCYFRTNIQRQGRARKENEQRGVCGIEQTEFQKRKEKKNK